MYEIIVLCLTIKNYSL